MAVQNSPAKSSRTARRQNGPLLKRFPVRSSHGRIAVSLPRAAATNYWTKRNFATAHPAKYERIEIWQSPAAVKRVDRECECDPALDQAADIHFGWMEIEYGAGALGRLRQTQAELAPQCRSDRR
jgi:hypothetical protein